MSISVFDLFKIGIGPSSSHTVGPMLAAFKFVEHLSTSNQLNNVQRLQINFYGSLGATGKGHGTDKAVVLGLIGEHPDSVDVDTVPDVVNTIQISKVIQLLNKHNIVFDSENDLVFNRRKSLSFHPNGMRFTAFAKNNKVLQEKTYFSIGGGFVIEEDESKKPQLVPDSTPLKYPFNSADELLALCHEHGISISGLMLKNELVWRSEKEIQEKLLIIWQVMQECVKRGCETEGVLPGGMKVKRRAAHLARKLESEPENNEAAMNVLDWVDVFAIAVNEENAAGGRVVTAPTNGAAGIIPAVLHYYWKFCTGCNNKNIARFLLTAAAIGILFKKNASISGAEVGCQGEVGAACSMAAAGLTEVLGGTPEQVENAAEIGMEHNLGLTCDPVGGLVQVPCIERNAMGAVKAINASRLALRGDGRHFVSLDKVIKTMRETGADMKTKYKETARGGLAVNIIEC